jgi:hypothetical protein
MESKEISRLPKVRKSSTRADILLNEFSQIISRVAAGGTNDVASVETNRETALSIPSFAGS